MALPLAEEILRNLLEANGEPVSGQSLARELGVTRAAVWKGVGALRRAGLTVESLPARGYRLRGGPRGLRPAEIASRLGSTRLGSPARHLDEVDSTNREAERWALAGAPEGALVVAEHQTAGRGRLGRHWHDHPGRHLLFSLVLRPPVPTAEAPALTFAAAAALADSVAQWVPAAAVAIKWPNDVLLGGRKAAGILSEMRAEGQRVEHVILGVGVNVAGAAADYPEELRATATTVATRASGARPPERLDLLCAFLERFADLYRGFLDQGSAALLGPWNRWFRSAGEWLRVTTPHGVVEGRARGLGPGGALLLEADGVVHTVLAGDVEHGTARVP